ncbi:hypothetical protein [Romboutsia sp. 1001713B170207_170306_H8]|uniref:hypothetical protein n=1 Tax=Romboutsia sp. 1001713B170207_170306_H8 TaxID=2787112 RepID=UPI000821B62F|nr:hypothetical protein [Romboutsia sp. 1001713B170207_170306_H8]SCH86011.1 Uncharacterised protein [uncultured Clostridium sp.]
MTQEKVIVKDKNDIIEITYDDILKYHGREMIGGAALAFKIMLMTFPRLCNEIPQRGRFSFYSGIGKNGRGIIDATEMVMRVKTHNNLRLDLAYSDDKLGQVAPGGGRYYFEIGYDDKLVKLYLKEGIIPEEFIAYSKLSHKCKAENISMKVEDQEKLLLLRQELASSIIKSKPEDLFVII